MANRETLKVIRVKKDRLTGKKPYKKIPVGESIQIDDIPAFGQTVEITWESQTSFIRVSDYKLRTKAL